MRIYYFKLSNESQCVYRVPSSETVIASSEELKEAPATSTTKKPVAKKKNGNFGGFSAGFLSNPRPKKKKQVKKDNVEDISHIKATKAENNDSFKFKEVQDAIKDKKDEWCTPDLLSKIASNETLRKAFTSPEYRQ